MAKKDIMHTYGRFEPVFNKGKGIYLYDENDNEYLDFVSGIAVNTLGHCHPKIAETLKNQGQTLIHLSNLYWNDKQNNLAEKLVSLGEHDSVFFCNSGTEANEAALKLARKHGKSISASKNKIIYMKNSFHGRTMGALSVTGQGKYQEQFKPLIGAVVECEYNSIEDFNSKMDGEVCAVIMEVIQGEGGLIQVEEEFLKNVRKLCDEKEALLIFDEVQCGAGRLGTFFAYQKFGVVPDVVTMAKGLGGGFPIGAMLSKGKASSVLVPGDHGTTFGGNPLACAVALTVIEEVVDGGILAEVDKKSEYFCSKIEKLMARHKSIEKINGMGLLLGVKLSGVESKDFVAKAFEKGFLVVGAGNNVVRVIPPLNVTYEELDKGIEKIEEVLEELEK
jgi:acetylornithine/N-succinyldiaminopimelate aminotransferase